MFYKAYPLIAVETMFPKSRKRVLSLTRGTQTVMT